MTTRACRLFAGFVTSAAALCAQQDASRGIDVRVDPRTELMSVVFRLAGNPEYSQGRIEGYAAAVDEHFGRYRDHALVERARELRRRRGIGYDAPMSLAVHLEPGLALRLAVPLDPWPDDLDRRWTEDDVRGFLRDAKRFVRDTHFERFLEEHAELHATACARVRTVLDEHARLAWFDEFFGERPTARFTLSIGMLNGGGNYGPRARMTDGTEQLWSVLGAWKTDADGLPVFDESFVSTIVHEFCHSYCNHLVDAHADALVTAGESLWPHVAESMRAQAYADWSTMMKESLVRACVVRYMAATGGAEARRAEVLEQVQRDFLWTGELSDELARYEQERDRYADLAAFMPQVVEFFDGYAPVLEARLARAPHVAAMTPANGQRDVDPATAAIVVTFDRPMLDGAWAVVGGGPDFPELTGKPSYDDTRTVLTIPVRLKPSWDYELWLNRGRYASFQSAERVALRPVHVTFRTRG